MKNKVSKFLQPMDFSSAIEKEMGSIDFGDVLSDHSRKKEKLFLRNFSAQDLYDIIKHIKLLDHLKTKGFDDVRVEIDVDDSLVHHMKLYFKKVDPDNILLDLRLSESRFVPEKEYFEDLSIHVYDMIVIEWLSAQNPVDKFDEGKPQLPGQRRPGLGILSYCFEMMYIVASEVIKDGFLDIPDHMHGAIMYSKKFKFFNPVHEGIMRAIMRDLGKHSLLDISWGILTKTIIDEYKNEPLVYAPSEQVFYVSDRMREYFHSKKYLSVYNKYYKRKHYRFDYEEMLKKRQKMLETKSVADL